MATPVLPTYLENQTPAGVLARMLVDVTGIDKSEGSWEWDLLATTSVELAFLGLVVQQVLEQGYVQTAKGVYLDLRGQEHAVPRREATKATGTVTFHGAAGTVVPILTQVSTESLPGGAATLFQTTAAATIPAGGAVDVAVEAMVAGAQGVVEPGRILMVLTSAPGVTAVTNDAATVDGTDEEDDEVYRRRILFRVQNPSSSGNQADYVAWGMEVEGVGAIGVIPTEQGPGSVGVCVTTSDGLPAPQSLLDLVQAHISPVWRFTVQAEAMSVFNANGVTTIDRADDTGTSKQLAYSGAGNGQLRTDTLQLQLPRPGIWRALFRLLVDNSVGVVDAVATQIFNVTNNAYAATKADLTGSASRILSAAGSGPVFNVYEQQFYWNGTDVLQTRIIRQPADTVALVIVDQVEYVSAFGQDTGDPVGKAPIGARVLVHSVDPIALAVAGTIVVTTGSDRSGVLEAVDASIQAYVLGRALSLTDRSIRYFEITRAIYNTPGVYGFSGVTVNGAAVDVVVDTCEVGVLTTTTWS